MFVSIIQLQFSRESYVIFPVDTFIAVNPEQRKNDNLLIEVTLSGMTNSPVNPVQSENAYSPIEVTRLPRLIAVNPVQSSNANSRIEVTLSGMTNSPVNPVQPLNASLLIEVTLSGMVIAVNLVQSLNAHQSISVSSNL